jgi:ABC-type amino acid transport substrate-binding protein
MIRTRFFMISVGLSLWCGAAFSETCKTLVVTGSPSSPPSSWVDDQKLVGASIEFIEKIALAAGVKKVEKKVFETWNEVLVAMQLGQADVIVSTALSPERERYLNFIRPSYTSHTLYVVVRKGESFPFLKYDDLLGRRGAGLLGDVYGHGAFAQFVNKKLSLVRSQTFLGSIELLFNNQVDYILGYENDVNSTIFRNNLIGKVDIVLTIPYYAETYIALSKHSKCSSLASSFSAEIIKANKVNLYYQLQKKYLGFFEQYTPDVERDTVK